MKHRCPVCHKAVKVLPQDESKKAKFFPFCSRRCKLVDLGAWLDARYKIISRSHSQGSGESAGGSSDSPSDKW